MKKITILLLLNPIFSFGQDTASDTSAINKTVEVIEKLSRTNNVNYNRNKSINNKKFNEAWQHFDIKEYSRLIIEYQIDSTVYSEKYYFRNGLLIYSFQLEFQVYPHLGVDQYKIWTWDYYFSNGKLIDYIPLDHGKSELDDADPESEILERLEKRKAGLKLFNSKTKKRQKNDQKPIATN